MSDEAALGSMTSVCVCISFTFISIDQPAEGRPNQSIDRFIQVQATRFFLFEPSLDSFTLQPFLGDLNCTRHTCGSRRRNHTHLMNNMQSNTSVYSNGSGSPSRSVSARYARWIRRVIGQAPDPMARPSTEATGVSSPIVPVVKTSSAA